MNNQDLVLENLDVVELEKLRSLAKLRGVKPKKKLDSSIARVARDAPLPLSLAQQRLWFLAQMQGVSATYHMPAALRLRGVLDTSALRRAFDALLARHEALRTTFIAVDGQPQVALLPEQQPFPLSEHDLQEHSDPVATLHQLSHEEALAPFDLAKGPLIRARLLRMAETEHVLLITQHHIVSDGWSLGILVNEFNALYRAFVQGQPDPLAPLAVQYPDYAAWQRQWLTEQRSAEQLDYWHRALAGAPALLTVPTDRPRSAARSHTGAAVPLHLDAALTAALKQLSQRHDTTLFTTLLTAWAVLLSRLSGQDDMVIGAPSANRVRREIEPLVGFFVNTLALRVDLSGDPDVSELLGRVHNIAMAAQDHQDVSLDQVVERVNPPRRAEHAPLFQMVFTWQNKRETHFDLHNLRVEQIPARYETTKFDIELILSEVDGCVHGVFLYATALFDASTLERIARRLGRVLEQFVSTHPIRVSEFDLDPPMSLPVIVPQTRDTPTIPLSWHQERIWFIDTFERGYLYDASPIYHKPSCRHSCR